MEKRAKRKWLGFAVFAVGVMVMAGGYVCLRLITMSPLVERYQWLVWAQVPLLIFLNVLARVWHQTKEPTQTSNIVVQWASTIHLGLFSYFFLYLVIHDVASVFGLVIPQVEEFLNVYGFPSVVALSSLTMLIAMFQANRSAPLIKVTVPIDNLPMELSGLKIVQISDLHIGPTLGEVYCRRIVEKTNALEPDMVVLTGDLIDGFPEQLKERVAPLAELKARYGVFFVTGNHEYYWSHTQWVEHLKSLGIKVLSNSHQLLAEGKLAVAGIPDRQGVSFGDLKPNIAQALDQAPEKSVKILLSHRPDPYDEAEKQGVHLQLSGHTHSGQTIPWNFIVARMYRYYKGLNRHEKMWLYISRGTGYWGPPIRFPKPNELTLLTLLSK